MLKKFYKFSNRKVKNILQISNQKENIMSKRYSGKSEKDSSTMKKAKLSIKEKRKIKKEKKKNKV